MDCQLRVLQPSDVYGIDLSLPDHFRFSRFRVARPGGWQAIVGARQFASEFVERTKDQKGGERLEVELHSCFPSLTATPQAYLDQVRVVELPAWIDVRDLSINEPQLARLRNVQTVLFRNGDEVGVDIEANEEKEDFSRRFEFWGNFLQRIVPRVWPAANEFGWQLTNSLQHFLHTSLRLPHYPAIIRLDCMEANSEMRNEPDMYKTMWDAVLQHLLTKPRVLQSCLFTLWNFSESFASVWQSWLPDFRLGPSIKLLKLRYPWSADISRLLQSNMSTLQHLLIDNQYPDFGLPSLPIPGQTRASIVELDIVSSAERRDDFLTLPRNLTGMWIRDFLVGNPSETTQLEHELVPFATLYSVEFKDPRGYDSLRKRLRETVAPKKQDLRPTVAAGLRGLARASVPAISGSVDPLISPILHLASTPLVSLFMDRSDEE